MMNALIGHEPVFERFLTAVRAGQLHHAWLLHGAGGIGKSLLAEHMAAAYLCERNLAAGCASAACGACHGCRMREAGSHPDMFELRLEQKKRDISVEQARELLDFLSLKGAESIRRVAIIDDAEALNKAAANALLKGLEEPGGGLLLILVCADMQSLPATLRSRCFLQPCQSLSPDDCGRVFDVLGMQGDAVRLARQMADGRPGKVACLADESVGVAAGEWWRLTTDLVVADVGQIDAWIGKHIARLPHALIADVVLHHASPRLASASPFDAADALYVEAKRMAMWPETVRRHTLRPGPSLLAHVLGLRLALRQLDQAV